MKPRQAKWLRDTDKRTQGVEEFNPWSDHRHAVNVTCREVSCKAVGTKYERVRDELGRMGTKS